MRAAVCREFGLLVVEDLDLAEPGPGEVKVRIEAAAICHSDITYLDGGWGGPLPSLYGHEGAGIVEQIGSGVRTVSVGDKVVVTLVRSCGHCVGCAAGQPVTCRTRFPLDDHSPLRDASGAPVVQAMRTGAFAEYVVVEASQLVVVPADLGSDVASLLACSVITGFGAVTNTARVPSGSHVVIVGCGGVGLNAIQGARTVGAQTIIAADVVASKLQAAMTFGATHTVNSAETDLRAAVMDITGGYGADYVFVTVGAHAAFESATSLLAWGGTAVIVGMPNSGVTFPVDAGALADYSQRIIGSKMGSARIGADIPNLVALYRQGRIKLDELITGRYRLDEINAAIAAVKRGDALRNVIVFE